MYNMMAERLENKSKDVKDPFPGTTGAQVQASRPSFNPKHLRLTHPFQIPVDLSSRPRSPKGVIDKASHKLHFPAQEADLAVAPGRGKP
jgi:hypothetical protein